MATLTEYSHRERQKLKDTVLAASCVCSKHYNQIRWKGKGSFNLTHSSSRREGRAGVQGRHGKRKWTDHGGMERGSEQRPWRNGKRKWTETVEECCLLTAGLRFMLSLLLSFLPSSFLLFFFLRLYLYLIFCACAVSRRPEGSIRFFRTGGCELSCGCLEWKASPLEEQTVVLTAEPSLHP